MQRYFSHICHGTDVQADWRSCTYGRAPNAIEISYCSLTCPSYTDTGPTILYGDTDTQPHLVAFLDTLGIRRMYSRLTLGIRRMYSRLKPLASSRGTSYQMSPEREDLVINRRQQRDMIIVIKPFPLCNNIGNIMYIDFPNHVGSKHNISFLEIAASTHAICSFFKLNSKSDSFRQFLFARWIINLGRYNGDG